ncbi:hypothetical protein Tco_0157712 [Tanacetum coccineum]
MKPCWYAPSTTPSTEVKIQATFHANSVLDGPTINTDKENVCGIGKEHRIDAGKPNLSSFARALIEVDATCGLKDKLWTAEEQFSQVVSNNSRRKRMSILTGLEEELSHVLKNDSH